MMDPNLNARSSDDNPVDPVNLTPYLEDPNPLLVVVSGPSAVGKDSVIKRMKELNYPFHFVVTATTRPPRENERHGEDYFFLSEREFLRLKEEGELLEHALVYEQHKGVPKEQIRCALASGQDVMMRLDVQGAATVHGLIPDAILIFLIAGSEEELIGRLRKRGTETAQGLARRIATVREEMERIPEFDYVVANRDGELDCAVEKIAAIITAEKCRTQQRAICL
jgi:guanylate kinase